MEGKINQATENRKRLMMHQPGLHHIPKYRPNSSAGFAPRNPRPPMSRPNFPNHSGGNLRPGGNNHYNHGNSNKFNRAPPRPTNPNNNTAPRTGSNAIPVAGKD